MKKRIFIVHRWSGSPNDDWRPWLKKELEKLGHDVFVPEMPDTETPVIEKWVEHLAQVVVKADENTFFVGHSIGCQTILRYLETLSEPVGGAVFVAGWFKLENLEDKEVERIAEPWIITPIDATKIRTILPKSTLIISDNDPFGAGGMNKLKFIEIGSKIVSLRNAGHITEDDGYVKLPEILDELNKF